MKTKIQKSNLLRALRIAIQQTAIQEEPLPYRSAFLAGLEQNFDDLMNGAELEVVDE